MRNYFVVALAIGLFSITGYAIADSNSDDAQKAAVDSAGMVGSGRQ